MASVKQRSLLRLWQDVIFALFVRHLVSKFNDKFGVSWLIIQPVAFIVIMSFIRGRLEGGLIHGLEPFVFMLVGFVSILQFLQAWSTVSRSILKDRPLYAFRQVQPIASVTTTVLVEFIAFVLVLSVLSLITLMFGLGQPINDPLSVLLFLIEIQVISYCLGLIFAVAVMFVKEVEKVQALFQRPMLFISGTFFSLNDIPTDIWPFLIWNPVLHGVEMTRHAITPNFPLASAISPLYFHLSTMILLYLGLGIYVAYWKKAISR